MSEDKEEALKKSVSLDKDKVDSLSFTEKETNLEIPEDEEEVREDHHEPEDIEGSSKEESTDDKQE